MIKKITLLDILNFTTIACSISFKVTIFPYMLFYNLQYSDFFVLGLVALEIFTLAINKVKGLPLRTDFLKFRPIWAYFGIMLVQFVIAIGYQKINSIGAATLYYADCWLLCILVYSLCYKRINNSDISEAAPIEYNIFAILNVLLVCISSTLIVANILPSMTNDVSNMCVLFQGNVENGQTYYMPYYLSLQNPSIRLTSLGELTGWAFEPHLFCLLVFPACFYLLCRTNRTLLKCVFVSLFIYSAFWGFSVTGFLSLALVGIAMILCEGSKSVHKIILILVGIVLIVVFVGEQIQDSLLIEYTKNKLIDNTASADYSKSNLEWSLSPSSIVGQGIMRWDLANNHNPDIGFISFMMLIIYYGSTLYFIIKTIMSHNRQSRYLGYGVLYMYLHSMKMANAIFCMPIIAMNLIILFFAYKNRNLVYEGTKN